MDPLSVTASVIACLQATSAVISVCLDYRSALKHTPWGLSKVTEEVRDLRNVLESLQSVADRLESQTLTTGPEDKKRYASLQLLCSPERGPLQNCTTELNQLENILCPPKWSQNLGKRHKALIQAAGWRMKDSEVKEYLKSIERYKTTLNLALTADEA